MRYLIVATAEELQLPAAQGTGRVPIIMGVGGTNVIQSLMLIDRFADILNVGYAGSQYYDIGTEVKIEESRLWHPNCTFEEPTFHLHGGDALCLTAGDFITSGNLPPKSVIDMELAYIAAMGFRNLTSVKYVSDRLDYREYEEALNAATTS